MFNLGKITIFRLTATGDDQTTSDKIEFNTTDKTNIEAAHITDLQFNPSDGVGNNQGAEQELGDQQALGIVEDVIKITGFISQRNGNLNNGRNSFLVLMDTWEHEAKASKIWKLGRFGFFDEDDHTEDTIPVKTGDNQIALLWERVKWTVDMKGNRKFFDLYLRVNRGDSN